MDALAGSAPPPCGPCPKPVTSKVAASSEQQGKATPTGPRSWGNSRSHTCLHISQLILN